MYRCCKSLAALGLGVLLLGLGTWAQQNVTIIINQSLYLDCVPPGQPGNITYTIQQSDIEGPQPFDIGDWGCNVDAVTQYRLNSQFTSFSAPFIVNADTSDFTTDCDTADDFGTCAANSSLTLGDVDPNTRRGTGFNTAGTDGADFGGDVFLNIGTGPTGWDVMSSNLPVTATGVITYTVTDTTP
ncbi:MAG: hypothetical protein NZ610_02910 [Candidatus Bipolaricaulota bacterium]|nr:hypothetical protein [Candidatus Bipolaricaulota bacterium]MCS7274343.1 hypothetical protein [Candidatus Bipolaricaulota bacterium]MDW8110473.1 hypothetical protein [Candidatus Bipolaricaulota bacterium]MDW8329154.1 hypothetical protein [Candidatus Bipolaricaulota bacterium]